MSPAADPQYGWLLGRVAGIPVYIGRSWPIIAVVVVMTFGPQLAGALPGGAGYAVAAAYALLLLVSVLVHEAGHALAARSTGSEVSRIVANLWGGHTVFGSGQRRPGTAALIAIAGPAGNLLLAGVGWLLLQVDLPAVPALLAWALAFSNVFVAVFNLLPGLPLDGGFVVEAVVWKVTGDRWLAMVVAGWLGRVVTVLAVVYLLAEPLLSGGRPSLVTIVWVAAHWGVPLAGGHPGDPRGDGPPGGGAGAGGTGAASGRRRAGVCQRGHCAGRVRAAARGAACRSCRPDGDARGVPGPGCLECGARRSVACGSCDGGLGSSALGVGRAGRAW
jgi:Zn-dependent protease